MSKVDIRKASEFGDDDARNYDVAIRQVDRNAFDITMHNLDALGVVEILSMLDAEKCVQILTWFLAKGIITPDEVTSEMSDDCKMVLADALGASDDEDS